MIDYSQVAASMVSCTFLSGPLMFVSAKMIAAASMNADDYNRLLEAFEFDISILSFIGGVRILLVIHSLSTNNLIKVFIEMIIPN